jgi:3-oxoadipate enol-lactonase
MKTSRLPTGVTLEYDIAGDAQAEVVCFVHGAAAHMRQFEAQQRRFERSHRVLRLSLRGHGGSSAVDRPRPVDYARSTLARDVVALWDELGIARAHVVGNSLGGLVGFELLSLAPRRLRSLTTFGTTAALASPAALTWTMTTLQRLLGSRGMSRLLARTASHDRAVARLVAEMCRSADTHAVRLVMQDIATYDYTAFLREQTLPMLLVRGERDAGINANLGSTLAALAATPRFTLADLPGTGHFANLERPDAFARVLTRFLASVDAERAVRSPYGRASGNRAQAEPVRDLQPA